MTTLLFHSSGSTRAKKEGIRYSRLSSFFPLLIPSLWFHLIYLTGQSRGYFTKSNQLLVALGKAVFSLEAM